LPEAAVRESRDRMRAAILNSGYQFPNRRVTINLAPADLPKEGGRFDLPIARASSPPPARFRRRRCKTPKCWVSCH
jgi:predicted ATPase with chaperone activity